MYLQCDTWYINYKIKIMLFFRVKYDLKLWWLWVEPIGINFWTIYFYEYYIKLMGIDIKQFTYDCFREYIGKINLIVNLLHWNKRFWISKITQQISVHNSFITLKSTAVHFFSSFIHIKQYCKIGITLFNHNSHTCTVK